MGFSILGIRVSHRVIWGLWGIYRVWDLGGVSPKRYEGSLGVPLKRVIGVV